MYADKLRVKLEKMSQSYKKAKMATLMNKKY